MADNLTEKLMTLVDAEETSKKAIPKPLYPSYSVALQANECNVSREDQKQHPLRVEYKDKDKAQNWYIKIANSTQLSFFSYGDQEKLFINEYSSLINANKHLYDKYSNIIVTDSNLTREGINNFV